MPYTKHMHYSQLLNRKLIEISGDDAVVFLQGLVSNDVARLKEGDAAYAALLSPQGKFLHDFFLLRQHDTILMDCDAASLSDLLARLAMYKLRAKVTISAKEELGIVAVWGDQKSPMGGFADPRLTDMGWRIPGNVKAICDQCEQQGIRAAAPDAYERLRLESGLPDGARDMVRDKSLLLEFGFEDLHGVDFAKGCYVGQEVTARSKYRGQVRKFIYRVEAHETLPETGTPVTLDGAPAGEIRSSLGNAGLALLGVAAVEKAYAENKHFMAGNAVFKAILPSWVSHPPKALTVTE
jgi:folate-binding protein YgfZ